MLIGFVELKTGQILEDIEFPDDYKIEHATFTQDMVHRFFNRKTGVNFGVLGDNIALISVQTLSD